MPWQVVTVTLNQTVPGLTAPGTYLLYAHIDTYGGTELDNDRFV
ncbi:MAG: hypothetical protein ACE5OP_11140 [Candidatus Glassbacteria bacterium]